MGRCKLECPDGETECCICCEKQDDCENRCDMMDSYEYFTLVLGIVNAAYIVVNIINQKWDVLVLNVIVCVLCIANFIAND